MDSYAVWRACVVCFAASLFAATTCAQTTTPDTQLPSVGELPAVCRAAKAQFHPLTPANLKQVKAELSQAVARLDRRLKDAGKNGQDWRKYLLWDQMHHQLSRPEDPDPAVLKSVCEKYTAGHEGLGLIWFVEVRQALRRYLETAAGVDNPKLKAAYEALMDSLADHLQTYAAKPTTEEALMIGRAVGQLEDAHQAPGVIRAIRHHFVHPNLFLEVSAEVLAAGIEGPVRETVPVRDFILGTDIYGTGLLSGQTSVELFADSTRGVFDTVFLATTKSRNVGYHGPVQIYSDGITRIGACKRFWVNAKGLASHPAVSNVVTETAITDICANRGSRLIERIAWKRAGKQKYEAEWIASRHAERRVNRRIDRQGTRLLGRANKAFLQKFRRPLLERKLFPQRLRFNTTSDALHVVTLQADPSQLAAPTAPPQLVEAPDLALRVHESMINNTAASALAGMTLREERFQQVVIDLLGELPERLKTEDQEPWAVSFARGQPISVKFADGGFTVKFRGREYFKGEKRHPGMDVTAVYKIEKTPRGFKAVRQGELQVFPPGFVPGGGKKLSTRQMVIRKLLQRRFGRIFEEELLGEGFVLPGKWAKAGKMKPVELICNGGWLTVTWRRVPSEAAVARSR